MARPDFRAAATVRLKAERSRGLSANVLRLIRGEEAPDPSAARMSRAAGETDPLAERDREADAPDTRTPARREPRRRLGLESASAWRATIRSEEKRFARYGTPVTLVVAELRGLEALTAESGGQAVDRLVDSVGISIRRRTRATDVIVREGSARLLAMLPETDEISAINCVERLRSQCDAWLEETGFPLRLAIGWAQPDRGGSLAEAMMVAEARLGADRGRFELEDQAGSGRAGRIQPRPAESRRSLLATNPPEWRSTDGERTRAGSSGPPTPVERR